MNKTQKTFKKCAAALLVASGFSLFSVGAQAAGLGRLTVFSGLGQPLKAEIDISASADELSGMSARLAPDEVFKKSGVEYAYVLAELKFKIVTKGKRTFLEVSTKRAVNEPFLDFLVELNWPSGRLVREYTFLLDPPEIKKHVAKGVKKPTTQMALQTELPPLVDTRTGASSASMEMPAKKPSEVASPYSSSIQGDYTVQKGDTLRTIAERAQYTGVTTEQMLIAIYKANPHAFVQNNINLLRSNVQLKMPTAEEASAVSEREARSLYARHVSEWNDYRQKLAEVAPSTSAESGQSASGKITQAKPQEQLPSAGLKQDQVRVSTTESGGKASAEIDHVAQASALKEAETRMQMLERNVMEMQKLLELKNQQIAELEMRAKGEATESAPMPLPETNTDMPGKDEQVDMPAEEAPIETPSETTNTDTPAEESPTDAPVEKPAETPPAEDPAPEPEPAPAPAPDVPPIPEAESSFIEDNMLLIGGGTLALLLVGGFVFYKRKRNASSNNDDDDDYISSMASSVLSEAMSNAAPLSATSFNEELNGNEGEVDPLSEAEVYIAYGRDPKAEEVLKDAIQKTPERIELHMRLLELYAKNESKTKFENLAKTVQEITHGEGENWAHTVELGQQLDPSNPLYAATNLPSVSDGFDIASVPPSLPPEDLASPEPAPQINAEPLDFNNEPQHDESLVVAPHNNEPLDFEAPAVDVSKVNLDLNAPAESSDVPSENEEANTKWDLAKAYEEMGDVDGAKELYQEIANNAAYPSSMREQAQSAFERLNA